MIKFSDETIRDAQAAFNASPMPLPHCWRVAAAVFEAAANKQADAELPSLDDVRGILDPRVLAEEAESAQANTRDCVEAKKPISSEAIDAKKHQDSHGVGGESQAQNNDGITTPESFVVGKRYRDQRGAIRGPLKAIRGGMLCPWARFESENCLYDINGKAVYSAGEDLLPGALPDELAESAYKPDDDGLANDLWTTYGGERDDKAGLLAVARLARELLQPCNGMMQVSDDGKTVTPLCEFRARAERAEAAIERVRAKIENVLRIPSNTDRGDGIDFALKDIAHILGFKITPVRELTVTWDQNTDSESDEITSEIDPLFSEEE